ncbi:hypothetical protein LIP_2372 [Limnochorda pilosa]|uniref:Uncharacterized protein n=1 Tax=Limnochorda pilosa TaxID=1555112 RepID=A0A0K2SM72_LIMPI|nr:hypothetical protein LIP_2372 [Limnochorda pilosa]
MSKPGGETRTAAFQVQSSPSQVARKTWGQLVAPRWVGTASLTVADRTIGWQRVVTLIRRR